MVDRRGKAVADRCGKAMVDRREKRWRRCDLRA